MISDENGAKKIYIYYLEVPKKVLDRAFKGG